jgi:hypothetical protein
VNPNPNVGMAARLPGANPNYLGTAWGAGPVACGLGLTTSILSMANPNPNISGGGMMAVVRARRAWGLQPWL